MYLSKDRQKTRYVHVCYILIYWRLFTANKCTQLHKYLQKKWVYTHIAIFTIKLTIENYIIIVIHLTEGFLKEQFCQNLVFWGRHKAIYLNERCNEAWYVSGLLYCIENIFYGSTFWVHGIFISVVYFPFWRKKIQINVAFTHF